MEQQTKSLKFKRQRKFLMIVPMMVLPFITLLFWALGGGKAQNTPFLVQKDRGLNMTLPDAYLSDEQPMDKMSYYAKASSDSAKLKQLIKNDPYYQIDHFVTADDKPSALEVNFKKKNLQSHTASALNPQVAQDSNEVKIYRKLQQLNETLDQAATAKVTPTENNITTATSHNIVNSEEIDRLEKMIAVVNQPGEEDQETKDLNKMLETILDIQHPERVEQKLKQYEIENKKEAFTVTAANNDNQVGLIENSFSEGLPIDPIQQLQLEPSNGFYSLEDEKQSTEISNAIQAVVHERQTVVNGSTVKLRLVNDTYLNNVLIPKDNFVYGTAALNGERLTISINSIRFQNSVYPVSLSVFDLDGMAGIYIPGAISRDVAKESADRAMQGVSLNSYDSSWEVQAASVGIETAKNLFSKKVKLIKVTVKAGYQILLQDQKQQQTF